jgi:serine/threonine protein kinase
MKRASVCFLQTFLPSTDDRSENRQLRLAKLSDGFDCGSNNMRSLLRIPTLRQVYFSGTADSPVGTNIDIYDYELMNLYEQFVREYRINQDLRHHSIVQILYSISENIFTTGQLSITCSIFWIKFILTQCISSRDLSLPSVTVLSETLESLTLECRSGYELESFSSDEHEYVQMDDQESKARDMVMNALLMVDAPMGDVVRQLVNLEYLFD